MIYPQNHSLPVAQSSSPISIQPTSLQESATRNKNKKNQLSDTNEV